jgi:heptosyltransferase-2
MHSFKRTYCLPFKYSIPNYIDVHLNKVSLYKRYIKFVRRRLYLYLKRQSQLEIFEILHEHQNILWINISAPSLGDSLMDLSSRTLLKNKNVDLFTDKKNSHIYDDDLFFNEVYTSIKDVTKLSYDLIIIDSYSTRSMRVKSNVALKTPFVGIFGYFNGPEVNRILFSFFQMNSLLGSLKNENEVRNLANNSITISKNDEMIVNSIIPKKFISFVLGGEWKYKTYNKWGEVIRKILTNDNELHIVLLGSHNAKNIANIILKEFPKQNIFNFVDKLSFNQSAGVIKKSQVVFCCDGGLMHAANAVNAENITLFARLSPKMLLTENKNSTNIYDKENVNNIPSKDILSKYYKKFTPSDSHLLDE